MAEAEVVAAEQSLRGVFCSRSTRPTVLASVSHRQEGGGREPREERGLLDYTGPGTQQLHGACPRFPLVLLQGGQQAGQHQA